MNNATASPRPCFSISFTLILGKRTSTSVGLMLWGGSLEIFISDILVMNFFCWMHQMKSSYKTKLDIHCFVFFFFWNTRGAYHLIGFWSSKKITSWSGIEPPTTPFDSGTSPLSSGSLVSSRIPLFFVIKSFADSLVAFGLHGTWSPHMFTPIDTLQDIQPRTKFQPCSDNYHEMFGLIVLFPHGLVIC